MRFFRDDLLRYDRGMKLVDLGCIGVLSLGSAPFLLAQEVSPVIALPTIGSWLMVEDGSPAHWLGALYEGKTLIEPINVAVIDPLAITSDEALDKFLSATSTGGFGEKWGHSSGYWALIGNEMFPQISSHDDTAFSDGQAVFENNHGRIFGPLRDGDRWVFVGALSRESFHPFAAHHHQFVSFNQARDQFAQRLSQGDTYRLWGYSLLGNVRNDAEGTTADHDGQAVVLEAIR
jgi:hypothetical protein